MDGRRPSEAAQGAAPGGNEAGACPVHGARWVSWTGRRCAFHLGSAAAWDGGNESGTHQTPASGTAAPSVDRLEKLRAQFCASHLS
jgi:hypothetical protein